MPNIISFPHKCLVSSLSLCRAQLNMENVCNCNLSKYRYFLFYTRTRARPKSRWISYNIFIYTSIYKMETKYKLYFVYTYATSNGICKNSNRVSSKKCRVWYARELCCTRTHRIHSQRGAKYAFANFKYHTFIRRFSLLYHWVDNKKR